MGIGLVIFCLGVIIWLIRLEWVVRQLVDIIDSDLKNRVKLAKDLESEE